MKGNTTVNRSIYWVEILRHYLCHYKRDGIYILKSMQDVLKKELKKALNILGIDGAEMTLEYPADLAHGDFATNVAMVAAKEAGKNPRELAEEVVAKLGDIDGIEKIEVAGPGFINFHLSRGYFADIAAKVDDDWGKSDTYKGHKEIFEYTDPNVFKVFHIGHLMPNVIGESLSRIAKFLGADVRQVNYQGDVGLHIAKALWGLSHDASLDVKNHDDLGKAYVAGNKAYEEDDDAKKEITNINKKVYAKDSSVYELYKTGRQTSLDHFEELYEILGTKFDQYFFESEVWEAGKACIEEGLKKGIFEESDGAIVFRGEKYGLHTRVFITSEGLPTYEAKDFGLVIAKNEYFPFDYSVIVTGKEQKEVFKVVFRAIQEFNPSFKGKLKHVYHGLMRLPEGKMASRAGNVVSGERLINDTISLSKERNSDLDVARQVAVAAIKYQILKQSLGKDMVYDQEQALSLEGDSGPYLQYTYVRAKSVLEKAGNNRATNRKVVPESIPEFERLMPRFPSVVERAANEYEPHHVTTYLTELASAFNSWYARERIIGDEYETYKLVLTRAFATTMKNGLWLLGIEAPEKM